MSFFSSISSAFSNLSSTKELEPESFDEYDQLNKKIKDYDLAPESEKATSAHQPSKEGLSFSKLEDRLNQLENQSATRREKP